MPDVTLLDIIGQCMLIDKLSVAFYNGLMAAGENTSLKRFWSKWASEEETHEDYWNQLISYAQSQELPQVFDEPQKVYADLSKRAENIRAMIADISPDMTPATAFSLAYRLETNKLHPAFRTLFRSFYPLAGNPVPDAVQESTIVKFSEALKKYGAVTPELNLVADTLQLLWEQNKLLTEHATQDELTSLHNRRGFMIIASQMASLAKRKNTPLTILITDINNFRRINEKYGNAKGDEIIQLVAKVLKKMLRGSDLIARFSADNFVALLPETSQEGGQTVADKLQGELQKVGPVGMELTLTSVVLQTNIMDNVEAELQSLVRQAEYRLFMKKQGSSA